MPFHRNMVASWWVVPIRVFSRSVALALAAATLAGCASDDASRMSEMEAQVTSRLAASPANAEGETPPREVIDLGAGFKVALKRATEASAGYKAAQMSEAQAVAGVGVASSGRRPQVSANGVVGGAREQGGDQLTGAAVDLTVAQLIYDGGATNAAIDEASARALAARAERVDQGNSVAFEAARAWVDLWSTDARLTLLRSKTSGMDTLVAQIARMASTGMIDRASSDAARRQILDVRLQQKALETERSDARTRFTRYFGAVPARVVEPGVIIDAKQLRAAAQDWRTAPALRRAASEVIVARSARDRAQAAFRPTVSLQLGASSPMDSEEALEATAGFRVQYRFNDGGRRKAELVAAQSRLAASEAQFTDGQYTGEAEMSAALSQMEALQSSMRIAAQKIRITASEAETARSQIATGQSNLAQLIEVEIENYRARDRRIQMRAEERLLRLNVAARIGLLGTVLDLE